ncbi:MAG: hypothetical protein KA712_11380 [Myxococcales bacterium]|nr:hypothetical protein [Myxococcales bacterium]
MSGSPSLPSKVHSTAVAALSVLLIAGCGEDLVDGDFGGVDLQAFFQDAGEIPTYQAREAFLDGAPVQLYDFGWAAAARDTPDEETRSRLSLDEDVRVPKVAPVNPMYFFFDSRGNPMFSAPILEAKTGYYTMPGGKGVRDPNPSADAPRDLAYPVRKRNLLIDPNRNVPDYQRPIVNVIFDRNEALLQQDYSGLWEVVTVIAPSGYEPDAIKSWETLEKGWDREQGDFKLKQTGHVINCPLVDSRSLVIPTIDAYDTSQRRNPQPLVELWYRRKRVDCYLVNGWPSLGRTTPGAEGKDTYELYKTTLDPDGVDDERLTVLDTDQFTLGEGTAARRQVVAPIGQIFIPRLRARSESFYLDYFITAGAKPRRTKGDPLGYRPIRWWWNIDVTDFGQEVTDGFIESAGFRNISKVDDSRLSPRTEPREGVVMNLPLTGARIGCSEATPDNDPCQSLGLVCSRLQGIRTDPACEPKRVRWGAYCAPTVASCQTVVAEDRPDAPDVPGDRVEQWFVLNRGRAGVEGIVDPAWLAKRQELQSNGARLVEVSNERLYGCLGDPVSGIGGCYLTCNSRLANLRQAETVKVTIEVENAEGRKTPVEIDMPLDSRCGAELMPGFRCMPVRNEFAESGGEYCLRDCNVSEGAAFSKARCQYATPAYFSDDFTGKDAAADSTCQTIAIPDGQDSDGKDKTYQFDACRKDPAFYPFPGE